MAVLAGGGGVEVGLGIGVGEGVGVVKYLPALWYLRSGSSESRQLLRPNTLQVGGTQQPEWLC
jgi:hypothetical protein